jgi:hypothetical protein
MNAPENELRWQDEILQVMYWMHGENLGQDVTAAQLNRFLHLQPAHLETAIERLGARGLLCARTDGSHVMVVQLTTRGLAEGKRRFLDEFSSYLGKDSHIECGDPACDCHSADWDGICHSAETP